MDRKEQNHLFNYNLVTLGNHKLHFTFIFRNDTRYTNLLPINIELDEEGNFACLRFNCTLKKFYNHLICRLWISMSAWMAI